MRHNANRTIYCLDLRSHESAQPYLDEIATENGDKLKVAKVNVDENPDLALQFDIMSIPTLIVFQDGQPVHRFQGASGKAGLLQQLDEFI